MAGFEQVKAKECNGKGKEQRAEEDLLTNSWPIVMAKAVGLERAQVRGLEESVH